MIGKLTSLEKGPERNVKLTISSTEVYSEISLPPGGLRPQSIDYYELFGMQKPLASLITLTFVLADGRRVQFYATKSRLDMGLLLDELDGTIGPRPRKILQNDA